MHVHFSTKSIYSQLQEDIRKYALERSLTLQSIYNNKTLKEEFMKVICPKNIN